MKLGCRFTPEDNACIFLCIYALVVVLVCLFVRSL